MAKNNSAKGRKIGRQKTRSTSQKVYTATRRWETNKKKKVARHVKRMAKKAAHRVKWQAKKDRKTTEK